MNSALLRAAAVELRTGVGYYDGVDGPLAHLLDVVAATLAAGSPLPDVVALAAGRVAEWIVLDDAEVAR